MECGNARLLCSCCQSSQNLPPHPSYKPIVTSLYMSCTCIKDYSTLKHFHLLLPSLHLSFLLYSPFLLLCLTIFWLYRACPWLNGSNVRNKLDLRRCANVEQSHVIQTTFQAGVQAPGAAGQCVSLLFRSIFRDFDSIFLISCQRHLQLSQD